MGSGVWVMGTQKMRLSASLAAAWEAEKLSILTLEKLAERAGDRKLKARLLARAAGCQAHASRILARLAALGGIPMPVPPDDVTVAASLDVALLDEAERANLLAERYTALANLARKVIDPSAAWVCELNHAEEADRVQELMELARMAAADLELQSRSAFLSPPA